MYNMKIILIVVAYCIGIIIGYVCGWIVYENTKQNTGTDVSEKVKPANLQDSIIKNPNAVLEIRTKEGCKTYKPTDVQYKIKSSDAAPEGFTLTYYPDIKEILAIVWFLPKENDENAASQKRGRVQEVDEADKGTKAEK